MPPLLRFLISRWSAWGFRRTSVTFWAEGEPGLSLRKVNSFQRRSERCAGEAAEERSHRTQLLFRCCTCPAGHSRGGRGGNQRQVLAHTELAFQAYHTGLEFGRAETFSDWTRSWKPFALAVCGNPNGVKPDNWVKIHLDGSTKRKDFYVGIKETVGHKPWDCLRSVRNIYPMNFWRELHYHRIRSLLRFYRSRCWGSQHREGIKRAGMRLAKGS